MGEIKTFFLRFFFAFICLVLSFSGRAAESGATPVYDLPFAEVRLLSCSDGIQGRHLVVGGLKIDLKEGWTLQKPHLKALNPAQLLWIDYPIRPDLQETKFYQESVFIPVVASVPQKGEMVYGVQGDVTACKSKADCLTLPIHIDLLLSKEQGQYTAYCAYITEMLKQVPTPQPEFLKGYGRFLADHLLELKFEGLSDLTQAFLQNDSGIHFQVKERQFLKNGVRFLVLLDSVSLKDQNWILLTNQGIFRVNIEEKKGTGIEPYPQISWGAFLMSGFMLFLCSPFFIFWGLKWPKNKAQYVAESAQMAQGTTLTILLFIALVIFFGPQVLGIYGSSYYWWGSLIVMLGCLFYLPKNLFFMAGLFFIWPKPYLVDALASLEGNASFIVMWGIGLILWQWIFFYFRFRGAHIWEKLIHKSLKKNPLDARVFFFLPTLCLIYWTVCQIRLPEIPYTKDIPLHSGLTVVCSGSECAPWLKVKSYALTFVDRKSDMGQYLLEKYPSYASALAIWMYDGEKTIFQKGISPKKIKLFLADWKNYHAHCKPMNPPAHFADAPHDL